jgi:hypothetical protein
MAASPDRQSGVGVAHFKVTPGEDELTTRVSALIAD